MNEVYTKFILTPGLQWADGAFTPKPSYEDAREAARAHEDGTPAAGLLGYDPKGEWWDVLIVDKTEAVKRKAQLLLGIDILWDGDTPVQFERGHGCEAVMYRNKRGERVIAFGGFLAGMMPAEEGTPAWENALEVVRRLGIEIKPARAFGCDKVEVAA